jgi:hypothetical protein
MLNLILKLMNQNWLFKKKKLAENNLLGTEEVPGVISFIIDV